MMMMVLSVTSKMVELDEMEQATEKVIKMECLMEKKTNYLEKRKGK